MITQTIEIKDLQHNDSYQSIHQEHLSFLVISGQILSASCIAESSYKQVVFSECTFYGCEFQGVSFDNCIFENCHFEFSHFRQSYFKNCNFQDCSWKASSTTNTIYRDCELSSLAPYLSQHNEHHTTDIYIELALVA